MSHKTKPKRRLGRGLGLLQLGAQILELGRELIDALLGVSQQQRPLLGCRLGGVEQLAASAQILLQLRQGCVPRVALFERRLQLLLPLFDEAAHPLELRHEAGVALLRHLLDLELEGLDLLRGDALELLELLGSLPSNVCGTGDVRAELGYVRCSPLLAQLGHRDGVAHGHEMLVKTTLLVLEVPGLVEQTRLKLPAQRLQALRVVRKRRRP